MARIAGYSDGNPEFDIVVDSSTSNLVAFVCPKQNVVDGWVSSLIFEGLGKVLAGDPNPTVDAALYAQRTDGMWETLESASTITLTTTSKTTRTFTLLAPVAVLKSRTIAVALRVKTGRVGYQAGENSRYEPDGQQILSGTVVGGTYPPAVWTPNTTTLLGDGRAVLFYGDGETNDVPTATNLVPTSNSTSSVVPEFTVRMTDDDLAEFGDRLVTHWLHIVGGTASSPTLTTVRYGPEPVPADDISAGIRDHAFRPPISLPAGIQWYRQAVTDLFGATSGWTSWTKFTITAGPSVTPLAMSPTKREAITGLSFGLHYDNPQGVNATSAILYLYQNGSLFRKSAPITVSWAPNTDQSITWAQLTAAGINGGGAWTDLAWDRSYDYAFQLTDSNAIQSAISARKTLTTNAAPGVPVIVAPRASIGLTRRPLLRATVVDKDDTSATGLLVIARLKNSAGTVLQTRAMSYNATAKEWQYQTLVADIPDPGPGVTVTYRWDAYAYDGTLFSGGQTGLTAASYAPEELFTYTQGPTVTLTYPTDGGTITTAAPTIVVSWLGGTATQVDVVVTPSGQPDNLIITFGFSGGSYTSPMGVPLPSNLFRDGVTYDFYGRVIVAGVLGKSDAYAATLDYPDFPAPANFRAEATRADNVPYASLVDLSWDPTTYPFGQFIRYVVLAIPAGATETSPEAIRIADIEDPARTRLTYAPRSGVTYTYRLTQIVQFGLDAIPSLSADQTLLIDIPAICLSVATNPERQVMLLWEGDEPTWTPNGEEQYRVGAASEIGFTWRRSTRYLTWSGSYPILNDGVHPLSPIAQRDALLALSRTTLLYRDWTGAFLYCRFPVGFPTWKLLDIDGWSVGISLRQEKLVFVPIGQEA